MSRRLFATCVTAAGFLAAPGVEAALTVQHRAVGCVLADMHPRLDARFEPAAEVARARVFFRVAGTPHWYSVEMTRQPGLWSGVLPRPKRSAERIEYYLEATDQSFAPVRTGEYAADVIAGAGACRGDLPMAAATPTARLVVTAAAAGAPAVPAGFAKAGLLVAGGLSGGAVVGIVGGGALAAGAVIVASRGGDQDGAEEPPSISGSWVGIGADGLHRDMVRPNLVPASCRREDDLFLELQESGGAVTGTARYVSRAGTTCDQEPTGTVRTFDVTGTQQGAAVRLTLVVMVAGGPSTHVLMGTLAGSRIGGTATSTLPGATGQGTWSVRRP